MKFSLAVYHLFEIPSLVFVSWTTKPALSYVLQAINNISNTYNFKVWSDKSLQFFFAHTRFKQRAS